MSDGIAWTAPGSTPAWITLHNLAVDKPIHIETTVGDAKEMLDIFSRAKVGRDVRVSVVVNFFIPESK